MMQRGEILAMMQQIRVQLSTFFGLSREQIVSKKCKKVSDQKY